jgi:molybdopterin converting factor small subunit
MCIRDSTTTARNAGGFLEECAARFGLAGLQSHVRIAVNDEFARNEHPILSGDKVVFLKPFSGG